MPTINNVFWELAAKLALSEYRLHQFQADEAYRRYIAAMAHLGVSEKDCQVKQLEARTADGENGTDPHYEGIGENGNDKYTGASWENVASGLGPRLYDDRYYESGGRRTFYPMPESDK